MAFTPPETGFEYTIVPDGNPPIPPTPPPIPPSWWPAPGSQPPYEWDSVQFSGNADPIVLNGYRIFLKYRVVTYQPGNPGLPGDIGDNYTYEYPPWELRSQKLELLNRPKDTVFSTPDSEALFVADPGDYGSAVAGIKNGSEYGYPGVFDKTKTAYIERLQPYTSTPVDGVVPVEPYDEDRGIYPIDTLTEYSPDTRPSVTLRYKLTTDYEVYNRKGSESVEILHTVYQRINNWGGVVTRIVDRAYFTHGRRPIAPSGDFYV